MDRSTRELLAGVCAISIVTTGVGTAGADVSDDVRPSVGAVAEVVAVEVGGDDS